MSDTTKAMRFCKDCKHFIDQVPPPRWFGLPRISTDSCYQFCDLPSGRDLVTGKNNYAHLERITGKCGPDGKMFEPKP